MLATDPVTFIRPILVKKEHKHYNGIIGQTKVMSTYWIPALCVKAQKPVMGLLKGVLISTASATKSSI